MPGTTADEKIAGLLEAQLHRKAVPIQVPRCCALLPISAQRSRQCCGVARLMIDDKPYCVRHASRLEGGNTIDHFPTVRKDQIMKSKAKQVRQGDVQLQPVVALPAGCIEAPYDKGRIVLAYGESTGHAHAIADHIDAHSGEIAEAAIARARLWKAPNGESYLEVVRPVHLRHEEHTEHELLPGIYKLPRQMEYSPAELRQVTD